MLERGKDVYMCRGEHGEDTREGVQQETRSASGGKANDQDVPRSGYHVGREGSRRIRHGGRRNTDRNRKEVD